MLIFMFKYMHMDVCVCVRNNTKNALKNLHVYMHLGNCD